MKRSNNRLIKLIRRHRFLFYIRFLLLGRNGRKERDTGCFNDYNRAADMPPYFSEVNAKIAIDPTADEFEKVRQIVMYLRTNVKIGPAVSASSEETLRKMLEKGGVCSDFSQVFNIFCVLNNIKVREWHIVGDLRTNSYGHALNEIWSQKLMKWVAIDSHEAMCFKNPGLPVPLSVAELIAGLRKSKVNFVSLFDYSDPGKERHHLLYSKTTIPYLIDRYDNKKIDYILNTFSNLPSIAVNALIILLGWNYRFVFLMDNYRRELFPFLYRK